MKVHVELIVRDDNDDQYLRTVTPYQSLDSIPFDDLARKAENILNIHGNAIINNLKNAVEKK